MNKKQIAVLLALATALAVFFLFDLGQYLNLQYLKRQQLALDALYHAKPLATAAAYFAIYVLVTGASIPGGLILTLAGGAIFGLAAGTALVSFASTIGATLAFLSARYLLGDWVQRRFGTMLRVVNKGIEAEGAWYLLTLRLIPAVPFFLINLLMGLTTMRLPVYFLVTQAGMLAVTLVYVNAGAQLAAIESSADILSLELILSFLLLASFPLLAKRLVGHLRTRRRRQKPRQEQKPHESL